MGNLIIINAGALWTDAEERRLEHSFMLGASLRELCVEHRRTPSAIVTRLVRLGHLVRRNDAADYIRVTPFCTFSDIQRINRQLTTEEACPPSSTS